MAGTRSCANRAHAARSPPHPACDRLRRTRPAPRTAADRCAGDASCRRARDPRDAALSRVPGRVQLGRGAHGHDRRQHRGARPVHTTDAAGRSAPELAGRRNRGRHRQRARLPAADRDPVLLHTAARGQRLSAASSVPARPADGERRPLGSRVHPAVVQLCVRDPRNHGDAHDPEPARSPGDDHDRAAHDLLRAAAGVRARDRGIHPEPRGRAVQPAGAGAVHPVCRGNRLGDGGGLSSEAHRDAHQLSPAAARAARVPLAQPAQPADRPVGAHADLPHAGSAPSSFR